MPDQPLPGGWHWEEGPANVAMANNGLSYAAIVGDPMREELAISPPSGDTVRISLDVVVALLRREGYEVTQEDPPDP